MVPIPPFLLILGLLISHGPLHINSIYSSLLLSHKLCFFSKGHSLQCYVLHDLARYVRIPLIVTLPFGLKCYETLHSCTRI